MKSLFASAALAALLACGAARAEPIKIKMACTASSDCASAMIARDEGIFAKHGLDVDLQLIGINTNIPPAIASDSIQIGGPTETVFLQAVDGGLDLVALAGASRMSEITWANVTAATRKGVEIKTAKDFEGKKVGAPGIGAFLQVLFVKWLMDNGADPAKVRFIEVTFPTQLDALKSGAVNAVLTAPPFSNRIVAAGVGDTSVRYVKDLGRTDPIISYVSTRAFADAHPEAVKAFRESIAEAAPIVNSDHEKASVAWSKFTKVPLDVVRKVNADHADPKLAADDFAWWVQTMKQQGMLQGDIDVKKLVYP